MPRRRGEMDGICAYCNKKMWINGLVGGEVVCNKCYVSDPNFNYKKTIFTMP